jgi:hypothetical protein
LMLFIRHSRSNQVMECILFQRKELKSGNLLDEF